MIYAIEINPTIFKPAQFTNLGLLVTLILPLITVGAAFVFLAITLLAAFNIIAHGDNPEAIKKSQQTIVWAVLGLIIVIVSFVAVQLIGKILGINNLLP